MYLTSCTTSGGSRDITTNYKDLCTASVVVPGGLGPQVRTRIVVQQYQGDGTTPCRLVVVPNTTKTFRITPNRHHLPIYSGGTLTLPMKAGCGSHAQAWTEVYVLSAPAVVVKFPNSVTSVLRVS